LLRIRLLHHGDLGPDTLQRLEMALKEAFPRSRITFDERGHSLPPSCFNQRHGQYNSTLILQFLQSSLKKGVDERILAVERADLYAGNLNFVFGEADPSTGIAVVSTHRLRPEFYGETPRPELFLSRLIKEAIHELGHTVGLGHCPDPVCVMHFSNCISDTDLKSPNFCPRCKSKLS